MDSKTMQEAYAAYEDDEMTAEEFDRRSENAEPVEIRLAITPFQMLKEFHEKFVYPMPDEPRLLDDERWELRKSLIEEEYEEFKEAVENGDLVNAFKELADLTYVVVGTSVEMGGNLDLVFREVHRSNMSKLGEDGEPIYREDGKVLKGPYYFEPDIAKALGL